MERKKVLIIGAGIAGLSAGCYLQMNGYNTEIFEMHNIAGGLCTAWKRRKFILDGCIHWLVGINPSVNFYYLWNELINMKRIQIHTFDEYARIIDRDGETFTIFADVDKLKEEMIRISPEDLKIIQTFVKGVKAFLDFDIPIEKATEVMTIFEKTAIKIKMIPKMLKIIKWGSIKGGDFAKKFKNPLLQKMFLWSYPDYFSMIAIFTNYAWLHKKSAGFPIGGSLKITNLIEKKYLKSGGRINFCSRVTKIIVKNDTACGIRLKNGKIYYGDIIVSAADGHHSIYELLNGRYKDESIKKYYESNIFEIGSTILYVSLGIARSFVKEGHWIFCPINKPIKIDEKNQMDYLNVYIRNFDPSLAPTGKTSLSIMINADSDYWINLRKNDIKRYRKEKDRIGEEIIQALESHFGKIKSKIEVCDIATPATFARFTNNWKGSTNGFSPTPKVMMKRLKKEIKGLKNFYMAGQWGTPGGGLPMVLATGRDVAQLICKYDKKRFVVDSFRN